MATTSVPARVSRSEETSDSLRRHHIERMPAHMPPVPVSQGPGRGACACGGGCPRCAGVPAFSSVVRSAVEESAAPLPAGIAHPLQSRFSQTLPRLQVHTGNAARRAAEALGTRAFTWAQNIVIGDRAPDLDTPEGLALLAHETAHVLQQDASRNVAPRLSRDPSLESEARQAADAAREGTTQPRVDTSAGTPGQVQREEPGVPNSLLHPFTSRGMFQLRLSPEMEFEMFRLRVRRWMLMGDSSSVSPDPDATDTGEASAGPVASPATLPPNWITPDAPSVQPDTGALLGSFSTRGVQAGAGDLDVAMQLFQDRYRFVSGLPDLRAIVPGFARQWVPNDWRRIIAQSLTNMTIDSALKHDHPTFIEASDQLLLNLTGDPGVVPIYINLPSISF